MLLQFKIIALSGYDVNSLKSYTVSKVRICDTSCIIYTILPCLTVIITVHSNSHISLSYLPFLISTMQILGAHTGFLGILL